MGYCYSNDGERFHGDFDTLQEAIDEAFSEADADGSCAEVVCVGEVERKTAGGYLTKGTVESLFEALAEAACEDCGDVAEDWLRFPTPAYVTRNGKKRLAYYAHRLTDLERETMQVVWEEHDASLKELTEKIMVLVDSWATEQGHQPTFWGVRNAHDYFRNGAKA